MTEMTRFVLIFIILSLLPCFVYAQSAPIGWNPYQFGRSVASQELSKNSGRRDNEFGVRYWASSAEVSYDVGKSPRLSRLEYVVDDSMAGEAFFYMDSQNSRYLFKGVVGLGGEQDGNVGDADFNANGSTGSNTNSKLSDGNLFYISADLGYKINALSTASAKTSFLGGVGFIQDTMTARGVVCKQTGNGTYAGTCTGGPGSVEVASNIKALGNEVELTTLRLGIENNYRPTRRLSWRNEIILVPYANFTNNDSHYLRTDLGPGLPNFRDYGRAYGVQLETVLEFKVIPRWSVNIGGRYWQFWAPETTTKVGNPTQSKSKSYEWDYSRMGLFIGTGYHF